MVKPLLATLAAFLVLASCGGSAGARLNPAATPSPALTASPSATSRATATASPVTTATSTPRPPGIVAGTYAYVAVSVATGWRSPGVVRAVDAPALANPARIADWIDAMSWSQKADLINRADTQLLLDDPVLVQALSGAWAQILIPDQATPLNVAGYPAWIPTVQLSAVAPPTTAIVATVAAPTAWLHGINSEATMELSFGTRLPVVADKGTSLQVGLPEGRSASIHRADVILSPPGTLAPTAGPVLATARQFLGLQYLWAGTSGFGYDCSGLVYLTYRTHGVLLPRDADAQATAGQWVAKALLQPGDLVFFGTSATGIHHVAIYAGDGNILESPQTGSPVRLVPLSTYTDYFTGRHVLP